LPEGSKNWQHALQLAREREKKLQEDAETVKKQLKAFQDAKKEQEMADMSETEKLKAVADEEIAKRGKLELKLVIREIIGNKTIPTPIRELLERTPWAIPAVQDELGDTFSWDEAIAAVEKFKPLEQADIEALRKKLNKIYDKNKQNHSYRLPLYRGISQSYFCSSRRGKNYRYGIEILSFSGRGKEKLLYLQPATASFAGNFKRYCLGRSKDSDRRAPAGL